VHKKHHYHCVDIIGIDIIIDIIVIIIVNSIFIIGNYCLVI